MQADTSIIYESLYPGQTLDGKKLLAQESQGCSTI